MSAYDLTDVDVLLVKNTRFDRATIELIKEKVYGSSSRKRKRKRGGPPRRTSREKTQIALEYFAHGLNLHNLRRLQCVQQKKPLSEATIYRYINSFIKNAYEVAVASLKWPDAATRLRWIEFTRPYVYPGFFGIIDGFDVALQRFGIRFQERQALYASNKKEVAMRFFVVCDLYGRFIFARAVKGRVQEGAGFHNHVVAQVGEDDWPEGQHILGDAIYRRPFSNATRVIAMAKGGYITPEMLKSMPTQMQHVHAARKAIEQCFGHMVNLFKLVAHRKSKKKDAKRIVFVAMWLHNLHVDRFCSSAQSWLALMLKIAEDLHSAREKRIICMESAREIGAALVDENEIQENENDGAHVPEEASTDEAEKSSTDEEEQNEDQPTRRKRARVSYAQLAGEDSYSTKCKVAKRRVVCSSEDCDAVGVKGFLGCIGSCKRWFCSTCWQASVLWKTRTLPILNDATGLCIECTEFSEKKTSKFTG